MYATISIKDISSISSYLESTRQELGKLEEKFTLITEELTEVTLKHQQCEHCVQQLGHRFHEVLDYLSNHYPAVKTACEDYMINKCEACAVLSRKSSEHFLSASEARAHAIKLAFSPLYDFQDAF